MIKTNIQKTFYGPFFRNSSGDKWHWVKDCPEYPAIADPESKISSIKPDKAELCDECLKRDPLNYSIINSNKSFR